MAHAEQASAHRLSPTSGRCPHRSQRILHDARVFLRVATVVVALSPATTRAGTLLIASDSLSARRPAPARADSIAAPAPRAGSSGAGAASAADVRGPLDLDRALALALGAPPSVAKSRFSGNAEIARARDEARWPNPTVDVTVENFGPKSQSRDEQTVTMTQPLGLGGRLGAQRGIAGALGRQLPYDLEVARRQFARQTGEAFVDSWWLEQRIARLERAEDVDEATIRASEERTRAGAAPITEALRARTTLATATIERRRAENDLADARLKLAQSWGARSADFDTLVLPPPSAAAVPGLDTLLAGIDRRPEMQRAAAATAVAQAKLRAARAQRAPEWSVVGGARHLNEIDQVLFLAGISAGLPLWNRRQDLVNAAELDVNAAELEERTQRLELERLLTGAWRRCRVAAEDYALARDTALPAAREALVKLAEGYRAGRFRYLDYLDGQHAALEAELSMLDAAREYWNARLAIEWSPATDTGSTAP